MRAVCLIPARSGSKGLKDKNMLFFDGKPLIFHTIQAAKDSGCFSLEDIYVNTDSQLYADICETQGVSTILRSKELAKDSTPTKAVGLDFLARFNEDVIYVLLQVTSPLRTGKQIREAMELFLEDVETVDNVVSYTELDKSPRLFTTINKEGFIQQSFGIDKDYRRQNENKVYYPNGAIFITTKFKYENTMSYFTSRTKTYLMDKSSSIDIDNRSDFVSSIASKYFDYSLQERKNKSFYKRTYNKFISDGWLNKKIILGDSRLLNVEFLGYSNLSLSGVTLSTVVENIENLISEAVVRPKVAIISLGINDIKASYPVEQIKADFKSLIIILKKWGIISTLTTIGYALFRDSVDNRLVTELNEWLKDFTTGEQIALIDINQELSEDEHMKYCYTADGLHYNSEGEKVLKKILEENI